MCWDVSQPLLCPTPAGHSRHAVSMSELNVKVFDNTLNAVGRAPSGFHLVVYVSGYPAFYYM